MRSVDPGILPAPVVWVVDDDRTVCRALYRLLRAAALDVELMRSGRELLDRLAGAIPDCLLLDLWLEDATGLELLPQFQLRAGNVPVVFMSGDADVRASVQAMKSGAVDFLEKPVDDGALLDAVIRAVARGRAWREARATRESASRRLATLTPRRARGVLAGGAGEAEQADRRRARHHREDHQGPSRACHAEAGGQLGGRPGAARATGG
jgi:FixJ family two-component response regulator